MAVKPQAPEAAMPSSRKQLNIRLDPETEARAERLLPMARARLGIAVSHSALYRLALIALEKEYTTSGPAAELGNTLTKADEFTGRAAKDRKPAAKKKRSGR